MPNIDSFYIDNDFYYYQDGYIAQEYDPNSNYYMGDMVFHNEDLFICASTSAVTGEWNSSYWWQMNISELCSWFYQTLFSEDGMLYQLMYEMDDLDEAVSHLESNIIGIDFSQIQTANIFSINDNTGTTSYYEIEYSNDLPISITNMATFEKIYISW